MEIINDIMDGVSKNNNSIIPNRKHKISKACSNYNSDSIILIAGKGHETVQLVGNESLPFDDAAIASHLMLQMQKEAVQ